MSRKKKKKSVCPTCGSAYRDVVNSAYDAAVPFKGKVSQKALRDSAGCSASDGFWWCGVCPNTWHDRRD